MGVPSVSETVGSPLDLHDSHGASVDKMEIMKSLGMS